MKPIVVRKSGIGWVAGPVYIRQRRGEMDVEARPPHYAATPEDALRAALAAPGRNGSRSKAKAQEAPAAHSSVVLSGQAALVKKHMISRGEITKLSAAAVLKVWNLPGRIYDIRQVYGQESVETVRVKNKNISGYHAKYVWRGRVS